MLWMGCESITLCTVQYSEIKHEAAMEFVFRAHGLPSLYVPAAKKQGA